MIDDEFLIVIVLIILVGVCMTIIFVILSIPLWVTMSVFTLIYIRVKYFSKVVDDVQS